MNIQKNSIRSKSYGRAKLSKKSPLYYNYTILIRVDYISLLKYIIVTIKKYNNVTIVLTT